ncbi:glycosyltransferase [Agromyces atrinae]|uniref:Dolichol-phosphate mannosyltransferase n=1 Tax=Agromyces atrinae TaxID=592376 RepID=A0A852SIT4_9MICO|nr:glycosyltransferase family 2 protein [Agromyces atrinae]NYD68405.1 dolichol-phosphate mannosyltransferase [Agromyces atrinae]
MPPASPLTSVSIIDTFSATIIVPTFNESPNVGELVRRIGTALVGDERAAGVEILFVDDSTDDTPAAVLLAAETSDIPVRLLHRDDPVGGLSGAVIAGMNASTGTWCVVMDGDLQHPPEMIPTLLDAGEATEADVVVASRHVPGGSDGGLSGWGRRLVSTVSIAATRAMFPNKLRNCTDPMTGFFAVRRAAVDVDALRPRGFKILLEILARQPLRVVEEPFVFGERFAGSSKATFTQGLRFLTQLFALRFGRMSAFAVVGALGAVANLAIMAGLVAVDVNYIIAAIIAAVVTIIGNFLLLEFFVFRDLRNEGKRFWTRFAQSFAFNGTEALIRLPLLAFLVQFHLMPSVVAQGLTLVLAFIVRFIFHSRVVYRPQRTTPISPLSTGTDVAPAPLDESAKP